MIPTSFARRSAPLALPLLVVGVMVAACGDDPTHPTDPITELPRPLGVSEQAVIRASNGFAVALLPQAYAGEDGPNVFLSPLSASMALGMTMNGTAGATHEQMSAMLGFQGMAEAEINESYRDLIALLLGLDRRVTFGLGNSVWARENVPFREAFYDRLQSYFAAEARELDFSDPAAPDVINAWVEDVTHGRIEELIDEIGPDVIMYLINAVYFKGDWTEQFDRADTRARPFHRSDGSTVDVPLMHMESEFRWFHTELARGVELPYGGGAFTAVAVLPGRDRTVDDVVAGLDEATWADWMDALERAEPREVVVELPRFELEYERTLNDDLQALGMTDAFDEVQADFTRLTPLDHPAGEGPPWVFISEVLQKTFLKVDEDGTEAAAATSVEIRVESAPPSFTFDRPFLFAIRERLSGTILFLGVIGDPTG